VKQGPVATGETVEVSVTHEIKIDGEKTWVGVRMTGTVGADETYAEARKRIDAEVQEGVMKSVESTVNTVKEYTK